MADKETGSKSATAAVDESTAAAKPKTTFKRQRELDEALDFIRNSRFGMVGTKRRPYSKQVKDEAARLFPFDNDIYKAASMLQRQTNRRYFTMRAFTFGLFCALTACTYFTLDGRSYPHMWSVLGGDIAAWSPAAKIALAGAVLMVLRFLIRRIYFWVLKHVVKELSFEVKQRYTNIINDCRIVANEIGNIAGEGEWSKRARNSMIVALWHAIRADYLDRFSTTVLWKTDVFFEHTEQTFWAIKAAAMALVTFLVFAAPGHRFEDIWLGLAVYLAVASTWFWFDRKPNGFVEDVFTHVNDGGHVTDESASGPYFFAMADEIENLVKLAQSGFFNALSAQGGKP